MNGLHGPAADRTYEAAGFGAPVQRGERPAIIVIDLTRGFTDTSFPTGSDLSSVVDSTNRLVAAARCAGAPVIYTSIEYTRAELESVAWLKKSSGMRALAAGSDAVELDERLLRADTDHLIVKKGASAFFGTGLASILSALHVDTVALCGATTSGCVRATAVDAVQSGFPVLVPRQCVGDRAPGPHDANLFDIQAKYGDVIELDDALAYVGAQRCPR